MPIYRGEEHGKKYLKWGLKGKKHFYDSADGKIRALNRIIKIVQRKAYIRKRKTNK